VEATFVQLQTLRRPELDSEDRDSLRDWVLVRRKGVELGFVDAVFFEAGERWRRRRKGVPLILSQVYFYTKRDDIDTFTGKLPFKLDWSDTREQVQKKLQAYESTRRSYLKDVWDVPGYRMTVDYKEDRQSMDSIVCQILAKPWPEDGRLQPSLGVADWLLLFGLPVASPHLRQRFRPLDLTRRLAESGDEYEADFLFECGLELYFVESGKLKLSKKPAPTHRTDLVLGAVSFFRSRELDARQWTGQLPFELSFDDTQAIALKKPGRPPDEQKDEQFSGYAVWHFPDFSLKVLYNNVENHLLRVTLMAPGFEAS
jgi:hypothetical protein